MRKHFTLTIIALFSIIIYSQAQVINKGDKLFGGSFSFSVFNLNNNGPSYNNGGNVGLFPSFGWAVKNNLVMGIRGSVSYSRSENQFNLTDKRIISSFSFGPGLFLKKYKLLKNKFGIYFDHSANVNYSVNKEKYPPSIDVSSDSWGLSYTFSPGVFYRFSENFFGEANIGGVSASYYSDGNTKNYGIGASFLQYFNLGINYRIPGKKS